MTNNQKLIHLKPVFPVLYLSVFIYTVFYMYVAYVTADAPPIVKGVVGISNQQAVLWVTYIFAFFLCVYDVLYYARLEVFEHHHKPFQSMSGAVVFFEFVIRFFLVGIVALKVIRFDVLDGLFEFSAFVCLLISVWLTYLWYFRIDTIHIFDLAPNLTIFTLSLIAVYFSSAPERQVDNAILVLIISILLSIVLAVGVIYLTIKFGCELYELTHDFIAKWCVANDEVSRTRGE